MFDEAFDRLIGHEGGFQADPNDRGNWTSGKIGFGELKGTKFGISAMTYPELDIQNLTREEAKEIYREWWIPDLPPAIQYQLFDSAVNHGMVNTTRFLQRAVGVVDDGALGPKTRGAIGQADLNDLLMKFLAERLIFMTHVQSWDYFGRGWARRIARNLRLAARDN